MSVEPLIVFSRAWVDRPLARRKGVRVLPARMLLGYLQALPRGAVRRADRARCTRVSSRALADPRARGVGGSGRKLVVNPMSMAPFSPRPGTPEDEPRRARLALLIAGVGIGAILLAYALAPGVRHAVGHAAHSVKHAVSRVFDHDEGRRAGHRRTRSHQHPAPVVHVTVRRPARGRFTPAARGVACEAWRAALPPPGPWN